MQGYALTVLDEASMWEYAAILHTRLQSNERKFNAVAALHALTDDEFQDVIDFVEGG
ncbi:MAG: hypothetical protein ABJF50_24140 [Paracoccaceae bacterium]